MPTVTMYKGSKFRMVCTNKELFTCTVQYYSTQEVEHLFLSHNYLLVWWYGLVVGNLYPIWNDIHAIIFNAVLLL